MGEFWRAEDADYPEFIKPAMEALRKEISEKRTYLSVNPKTDDPDDFVRALNLEKILNDAIAEDPGLLAEYDRMMAEVRERYKRFLLYGTDAPPPRPIAPTFAFLQRNGSPTEVLDRSPQQGSQTDLSGGAEL